MSRATRSTWKVQARQPLPVNRNLTDDQKHRTSRNRTKQNSNYKDDSHQNSSSDSEQTPCSVCHSYDNVSVDSSEEEESSSNSGSVIQEEQGRERNKKKYICNKCKLKNRGNLYIPESTHTSERLYDTFNRENLIIPESALTSEPLYDTFNRENLIIPESALTSDRLYDTFNRGNLIIPESALTSDRLYDTFNRGNLIIPESALTSDRLYDTFNRGNLIIPESALNSERLYDTFNREPCVDSRPGNRRSAPPSRRKKTETNDSRHDDLRDVPPSNRQKKSEKKVSNDFNILLISLGVVFLIIAAIVASVAIGSPEKEIIDMTLIKNSFPTQDEELWDAFEAGVEDVVTRQRPSTFILLYSEEAEQTLNKILPQLLKYAVCNITGCNKNAIEISDVELNSPQVVRDYGTFIETYRPKVEEEGVMVIKNLEKVRGISAQAFHSFCDEFTPLVEKSMFIFTMKVYQLPSSSERMKFTEEYLKHKWTDVDADILNALITRITSMVLEVRA